MKISKVFLSLMLMAFIAPPAVQADVADQVVGDVRVQVLMPSLVRIEQKGPKGFEDRQSFHIVNRDFPGTSVQRTVSGGYVNITASDFSVKVPENATDLNGITIVDNAGNQLWEMPAQAGYTTLKCRWPEIGDAYLYDAGDMVGYGSTAEDDSYLWILENANGYTQIKNKATGDYMNIENLQDYVECTDVESYWNSKDWIVSYIDGYMSIVCRWGAHSDIIHIENQKGYAEHALATTTNAEGKPMSQWWSALWGASSGGDSAFFDNNRYWLPHPQAEITAWAICDTPRYIPSEWGYNLPPVGADVNDNNGWDLENDSDDVYVFLPGGDAQLLRKEFLDLTGRAELMPLYAFGGWDSRYYAYTQQEALDKIDRYRSEQIPLDVFVIDTDWRVGASHGYGVATDLFPDMEQFLTDAHNKNVMVPFNDHPEPQADHVLDAVEVEYRNAGLRGLFDIGLDFWWFDRNWHTCIIPPDGINKEVFGMYLYHSVTQDYYPDRRPMIMANFDGIDNGALNRAPDMASHRYTMQWTGDTTATYSFLEGEIRNAVYAGAYGPFAYLSTDVGGHNGSNPSIEQYCRWIQFGSLSPVFRLHCTAGLTRDPWEYGETGLGMVRDYIQMRMRLLPLFYDYARKNYESGEPILRRCDLDYPQYEQASSNMQYMLGDGILIAPVYQGSTKAVDSAWLITASGANGLDAEYYNNMTVSGSPVVEVVESAVDFDWYTASPASGVNVNEFSARYTGTVTVKSDKAVQFGLVSDDGCRLWIDGQLVIDQWRDQGSATFYTTESYQPGQSYSVKIEYYENSGGAECRFISKLAENAVQDRDLWLPPGTWVDCWTGKTLKGPADITRSVPLDETPMYVKAGTIVALAPDMQYTGQKPWDNITLDVYPSAGNVAEASMYEDDGMSNDYKNNAFHKTFFTASVDNAAHKVTVDISAVQGGDYDGAVSDRSWTIRLRQPLDWTSKFKPASVKVNGKRSHYRIVKRNEDAMPFVVSGGSRDADVILIEVPAGSVDKANKVEVEFVPAFSASAIGQVDAGSSYSYPLSSLVINGSGNGLQNTADSLYFVNQPVNGNFEIIAELESLSSDSDSASAGLMCRSDAADNSPYVSIRLLGSSQLVCSYRLTAGQPFINIASMSVGSINKWLKMVRLADEFILYASFDGSYWYHIGEVEAALPASVLAGIAVSSGSQSELASAEFC